MISKNKIKALRALQYKKFRDIEKLFLVEGKKIVEEAINIHPQLIKEIFCTEELINTVPPEFNSITSECKSEDIKKISSLKNPQKILAVIKMHDYSILTADSIDKLVLALDSVRDPGNLGTIIRMADWFGIEHVICSTDTVECYNPKVIQASMGAIFRIKVHYTELDSFLENAGRNNVNIYGATLEGENLYQSDLKENSILLMGNESEGISANIRSKLTHELYIPNYSKSSEKTESLNVSIATSVILSEFKRSFNYSK